jgi:small ligand-binding sensory domain FIST
MPFAAALSEHPEATHAAGEVIGQVAERLGGARPDLAVVFATPPHADAFPDICRTVRQLLQPACLLGATAVAVVGGAREVEEQPGLSLWAATGIGRVVPTRLDSLTTASATLITGLPEAPGDEPRVLVVLPDPFTFPADAFLAHLGQHSPQVTALGGLASAARSPGGNVLALDDELFHDGAVGALLPPGVATTTVVSQGCRPVGRPFTVTRAEGQLLQELGGQPALQRLQELVGELPPEERELLAGGVHLGRVIDERKLDFERGDFLIRGVLGADRSTGALAVGDEVEVGSTVQFQVRDAASADEDLRELLAGHEADGALVFTCNGRGVHLFGQPDHDASVVSELTGTAALGGMFCAGEVGPVGGRTFLHGFTASLLLFRDARPAG